MGQMKRYRSLLGRGAVSEPRPVAADQGIGIRPLQTHEFEAVGLKLTATGAAARRTSFGKHTKEVTTINMRLDLMRHE